MGGAGACPGRCPQAWGAPPFALGGGLGLGRGLESLVSSVPTQAPPPAHARSLPGPRRLAQGPSGKLDLKADNF